MAEDMIEKLQKARETICTITGVSYETIINIQKKLRAAGVECNVSVGGLRVYANYQDDRVKKVCSKYKNVSIDPGVSRMQEDVLLGHKKINQDES